jgi:hypothetical protein
MRQKAKDRHHRKPTSMGGNNIPENISVVPVAMHRAYHQLFSNLPPNEVARLLTKTWIDSAFYLIAVPRNKSKRKIIKTTKGDFLQITFRIDRLKQFKEDS